MDIRQELGDGLVLRHATTADIDALAALQANAFANPDTGEPDKYLRGWTSDLMGGKHPTFRDGDFLAVEDTKTGALVSCVCLISQTWSMEGISFGVGRPEIVGTHTDYRNRGLVRAQFQALHRMSAERGELVQAITGVLSYYRQFGYEYAIDLDYARQTFIPQQIPELAEGETEKFRLRRSTHDDLDFIGEMYKRGTERSMLHCERDHACFTYEQWDENHPLNGFVGWWDVIETIDGERAGILYHRQFIYRGRNKIDAYELHPNFQWQDVTPFVLRELVRQENTLDNEDGKPFTSLQFFLSANHPMFALTGKTTSPYFDPYAWYIRVADLPAFLTRIAPLLEQRLAASDAFRNYSKPLRLNFYKRGLELNFENGKLKSVVPWQPHATENSHSGFGDAGFPDLTFTKLLFGYRSRRELQDMFPDCVSNPPDTGALLDVLFPKKPSHVLPLH